MSVVRRNVINPKREKWEMSVGFLILGLCLLTLLPWNVKAYGFDLDQSWGVAFHVAFRDRISFGDDFIYTYGPYGFLKSHTMFLPETFAYSFAFCCLIAIAAWLGIFSLVKHCWRQQNGSVWLLLPLILFLPNYALSVESFQYLLVILPLILYFYVDQKISLPLVLIIVNLALSSLTKHTYLMMGVFFVSLITIDEVTKLKRIPIIAPLYIAFTTLFWLFARQSLPDFPAYIINGLEIVRGFSAAMGYVGNPLEILLYMFGAGICLAVFAGVEWQNRRHWGILPMVALAGLLFITFKSAFTRHDAHALQALFNSVPVLLVYTAVLWQSLISRKWRLIGVRLSPLFISSIGAVILILMGSLVLHNHLNLNYGGYLSKVWQKNYLPHALQVITGQKDFQAIANEGDAAIRAFNPLPEVSGTVDLYPDELANIFANDLPYSPRPVPQSFSAYTAKLAQINAAHLRTKDAADSILFDINPIDERLSSMEDGLSWPEILTRYDIKNFDKRYLLLEKRAEPRRYQLQPREQKLNIALNEWHEITPATEPLWSEIELHPNLLGKLITMALRLPPIYLETITADGITTRHRIIGDVMSEGFLLSPIIDNRWDFLDLASPQWQEHLAAKEIVKFRIVSEGFNNWLYPHQYQLSLSQLKLERQDFDQVAGWNDWQEQTIKLQPIRGFLEPVALAGKTDKSALMAHAPQTSVVKFKTPQHSFSFGFGILATAVDQALERGEGDGVEFRVSGTTPDGRSEILFSRLLQPRINEQDRGLQQAEIMLGDYNAQQLTLQTIAVEDNTWDWSYWTNLAAK